MAEIQFSDSDIGNSAAGASVPTSAAPPTTGVDIEDLVRKSALRNGVDPDVAAHIARQESGFDQRALSTKGAIGVMQLMPQTAKEMNLDPFNMEQNIEGGVQYYKRMLNRFGGDTAKALAAYNAGPERVEAGGPLPQETQNYVNSILGRTSRGKEVEFSDADLPKQDIQFGTLGTQDQSLWQQLVGGAKGAASSLFHAAPYAVPQIPAVRAIPGLAAVTGPALDSVLQMYQRMTGEMTPEGGPAYPLSPQEAATRIRNVFLANNAGEGAQKVLEEWAPSAAKWLYKKALGVPDTAKADADTVADIVEHQIPLGIGKQRAINKWKEPANEALNDIYDKYKAVQVPGLVTTGVAGQRSAQQGAQMLQNTVSKTGLKAAIEDFYSSPEARTIPQAEKDAASKAFDNFFHDMPEDMDLNDLRKVKGHLQQKIPYQERTEGGQQARKVIDSIMTQHMAQAIPDMADRAKFISASQELRKAINAENLLDNAQRSRRLIGGYLAMPLAGAAVGGATSYYTHSDPTSAALRGALAGAMMSPGTPINAINLLNNPWGRALAGGITAQSAARGLGVPQAGMRFEDLPYAVQNALNDNVFGRQ